MPNRHVRTWTALVALVLGAGMATAQETKTTDPKTTETKAEQSKPATKDNKSRVARAMAPRLEEVSKLRERANTVTTKIGEIASSGKLGTSDDAVAALKELVQELAGINEQLKKMQEEIEEIKGWSEGQNENLPSLANDGADRKRFKN